jgi:hypothetical protein
MLIPLTAAKASTKEPTLTPFESTLYILTASVC